MFATVSGQCTGSAAGSLLTYTYTYPRVSSLFSMIQPSEFRLNLLINYACVIWYLRVRRACQLCMCVRYNDISSWTVCLIYYKIIILLLQQVDSTDKWPDMWQYCWPHIIYHVMRWFPRNNRMKMCVSPFHFYIVNTVWHAHALVIRMSACVCSFHTIAVTLCLCRQAQCQWHRQPHNIILIHYVYSTYY